MGYVVQTDSRHLNLQSGSSVVVKMGPFLDETDGKSTMESLLIAQADVRLSKNDGAFAPKNDATLASHNENGWYNVTLNGNDTYTEGTLLIHINKDGALPLWRKFKVREVTEN